MIEDVEIRQATAEDILAFFPNGMPRTAYAWIAYYKGEPACLAGLSIERGGAVAFSDLKPIALTAPKRIIWLAAQELFLKIKGLGLPMITAADPCLTGSKRFLERLGFKYVGERYGKEIYQCRV